MNGAVLELQEAVFRKLESHAPLASALGGVKIHDLTPAGLAFPYVTFGRADVHDWSTDMDSGCEVLFTLSAWSKHRGRREVLRLMQHVEDALDGDRLELPVHHLVSQQLEASEVRYNEDLDVFEGAMHFRAVIETG